MAVNMNPYLSGTTSTFCAEILQNRGKYKPKPYPHCAGLGSGLGLRWLVL
jgi:hypothetical protein